MEKIKFTIYLEPRTKKNSSQIIINPRTNRPMIIPSKKYKEYEEEAGWFVKATGIDYPVNVKCLFYMKTRRKVDLSNLISAISDVLVKYGVITDDNSSIIAGYDGSRVLYDKANARTEVTITPMKEEVKNDQF